MADSRNGSQSQSIASNSDGEESGPSSGMKGGGSKMNKHVASPSNTSKSGIKRQRVHFSCTECSRRKQKCNRETPCQHCIARKIPERCKIFQPGEDPNDLTTRVSRLEQSVNENFDRMFSMVNTLFNSNTRPGIQKGKQAQSQPHSNGIASWRDQINLTNAAKDGSVEKEAEGSEAGDEVVVFPKSEQTERPIPAGSSMDARFNSLISDSVDRQGALFQDPLLVTDPMAHIEGAAQLDAVMFELGATFSISQVLTSAMPPRELFDELIDHFFVHNNWLRQPLSRKRMMKTYERFWQNNGILHVNNINAYSTFMLAAAIGAITYRGRLKVSDDPRIIQLTTKRMFFAARQGLLISTMLGREDIQQVVAFHLASRYLFLDRRVSEAWSCVANGVRSALSIGLHRDGSILGLPSEEIAARRRIWSIVYFGERILCMNLGRPTAIDDNVVDTELVDDSDPTGEFDEYMKVLPGAKIPAGEKPKFLSFTRVRSQLAVMMGKVVRIYQNVHTPAHYSDVVALDHELDALQKTFPDHLRSDFDSAGEVRNVNMDWDNVYEFIPVHRYLQQAELLFVRMSLHRSYLLRPSYRGSAGKGAHNHHPHHRYNFSRRSCIEAAYQTLKLRADLTRTIYSRLKEGELPPSWVSHLGTFNTTSAIVILGIYLLMEPEAENADMLLRPLRAFYELHLIKRRRIGGKYDETKEREFTILRLFVERIDEARAAKANRNKGSNGKRGNEGDNVEDHRPKKNSRLGSQASLLPSDGEKIPFVESPQQRQSKEEDTASVLLDLNQGADTRRNKAAGQQNAKEQGKDEGLPWPYLPMRTPHHNNSNESPYGLASSSGSATNNHTPPMTTNGMNTNSSSSTDDTNGASVLQMFESWFRYNAFENIDADALGAGTQRLSNASSLPTVSNDGNSNNNNSSAPFAFSSSTDNSNTIAQGSWNGGATNAGPLPPPPSMNSAQSSSVPWSTVPMPSYSNNSNNEQLQQTQRPTSSRSKQDQSIMGSTNFTNPTSSISMGGGLDVSTQLAGIGIPPGMKNSFFDGTSIVDTNNDPSQNSINAASYDPAFWQTLMDKISG